MCSVPADDDDRKHDSDEGEDNPSIAFTQVDDSEEKKEEVDNSEEKKQDDDDDLRDTDEEGDETAGIEDVPLGETQGDDLDVTDLANDQSHHVCNEFFCIICHALCCLLMRCHVCL